MLMLIERGFPSPNEIYAMSSRAPHKVVGRNSSRATDSSH